MTEREWIEKIAPDAVYCARKYGYPASALIGQTCQETGYGITTLVRYNNVIGMKTTLLPYNSPTWPGRSIVKGTWEDVDGTRVDKDDSFRRYNSIRDCLEDYCLFMRAGELAKGVYKYRHILAWKDPEKVLRFITGKYATDRTYADKVLDIIKKHNLTQYDKEAYRVHYISNCGHDENGQYSGGAAGDQTGSEYQIKEWYSRPWDVVFEPPTKAIGDTTSELAIEAANNDLIGYDQGNRTSFDEMLIKYENYPKNIKEPCETDCSAADAAIVRAVGRILGIPALQNVSKDAYTGNLEKALTAAGFIAHRESKYTDSPDYIGNGWILLCTGHHTAISVSTGPKWEERKMSVKITRTPWIEAIDKKAKRGYEEKWVWDDSHSCPPCEDGKASCDRLPSSTLWTDFGVTWQKPGGWNSAELAVELPKLGFVETSDLSQIKPGAVVMVGKMVNGVWDPTYHTFVVLSYDPETGLCDKYDFGDTWRIQTQQPFRGVKICEWPERKVTKIFNVPDDDAPEKSEIDLIKEGQTALNEYFGAGLKVDGDHRKLTETAFIEAFQDCLNRDYYSDGPMPINGRLTALTIAGLGTHYLEKGEEQYIGTIIEIGQLLAGRDPGGVEFPGNYGDGLVKATGKERMTAADILAMFKPELLEE